ncbi:tripartite tricarboxylate transporter substrate binding protein [Candidatus Kaiserbacteria bacterium]|nr:tripartite tricarboxylate transporter substrate binding protein [Candidatus Kaiserbacteria bacterium]
MWYSRLVLAALFCVVVTDSAFGQGYPNRPIRLIIGTTAGTPPGLAALTLREELGRRAITLVPEARPGAAGLIAGELVARARPDGYTLLVVPSSYLSVTPHFHATMPFYPLEDLVPVVRLFVQQFVLAVPARSPLYSVADLVAAAKERPSTLLYGSSGVGSGQHLSGEMLSSLTGVQLVHVPYQGSGSLPDILSGRLDAVFSSTLITLPGVQGGKLRALGQTGGERSRLFPTVPTIGESIRGFRVDPWIAIFAPKGTPSAVVEFLNAEVTAALERADVQQAMAARDELFVRNRPQENAVRLREDSARYGTLIKTLGIKPAP